MFKWSAFAVLRRHPGAIVAAAAASFLSLRNEDAPGEIANDTTQAATGAALLEWATAYCQ